MSMGRQDLLLGSPAECALRSGWGVTNGWPLWLGESTDSIFRQGCSVGSLTRQGCRLCSMVTWGISCALHYLWSGRVTGCVPWQGGALVGFHDWAEF